MHMYHHHRAMISSAHARAGGLGASRTPLLLLHLHLRLRLVRHTPVSRNPRRLIDLLRSHLSQLRYATRARRVIKRGSARARELPSLRWGGLRLASSVKRTSFFSAAFCFAISSRYLLPSSSRCLLSASTSSRWALISTSCSTLLITCTDRCTRHALRRGHTRDVAND